jgi:1-acyl-sn-glycerol-3-phosphate acyltransferase
MWKQRSGFAAVAFEAGVPIIPVFTENIREAFVNLQTGGWFWRLIYRYINPNLHFQSTYLHIR